MTKPRAVIFDADGVLTLPEEFFSQVYARSRGLDPEPFERFFQEKFPPARIGKVDLKQLVKENQDLWQWDGNVDDLLHMWFETESVRNEPLLKLIQHVRKGGTPCFLATNQEKYRGEYLRNVMFKDELDGYFVSAELGFEKPSKEFFEAALAELSKLIPGLAPNEVLFFDDSTKNVMAAEAIGMSSYLYTGLDAAEEVLKRLA